MRFVYILVIGLFAFNMILLTTADFFPKTEYDAFATNTTGNVEYGKYEGGFANIVLPAVAASFTTFIGAVLIGIATKNVGLYTGIGMFMSILTGLWVGVSNILGELFKAAYVRDIYLVISICVGILATISIIEMLTGQQGGN